MKTNSYVIMKDVIHLKEYWIDKLKAKIAYMKEGIVEGKPENKWIQEGIDELEAYLKDYTEDPNGLVSESALFDHMLYL